jgi:hypothetical protein
MLCHPIYDCAIARVLILLDSSLIPGGLRALHEQNTRVKDIQRVHSKNDHGPVKYIYSDGGNQKS